MAAEGTEIPTVPAVQGTFMTLGACAFNLFASQRHIVYHCFWPYTRNGIARSHSNWRASPTENANNAGADTKTEVETTNQTNGHSDSTAVDQTKPAEDSESTEEAKAPESAEDKAEEPKAGDKREHETSTTKPAETEQLAAAEESSEPTAKKQKTDEGETTKAKSGTAAPKEETNGEEKKGSRGKKAKIPAAKPAVSTDGPGSRTRSRTKAAI